MSIVSYAQNFEDVMLWRALGHIEHGLYIDIGAQDPVVDSVSLTFHEHGWRGIHVEPTPHYAELLRQQRPGDKIIQAAVGSTKGILPFFEIPHTGISTADATIADLHRERGFDIHEISVPCITLATVFKECQAQEIHWLKIDVEGLEEQVLRSWGAAKARPWIVVVESTLPLTQTESHERWEALLLARHYSPVYFDGLNRYYVSAAHPELKPAFAVPPNVFDAFMLNGTASSTLHQLIETRHQSETSKTLEQHTRQRQDLQDEIERLSAGVATLGAAQEKYENAWAARERELAAIQLSATAQADIEKVTLALEHEHHEHALHADHAEQEAALTQRLQALESERGALQQEYANLEQTLVDQADQARQQIAKLQQTQAQRDREAQALAENIRALQAKFAQKENDLNAQVKIAQQHLRREQATRAKRAQNVAMRFLAIFRQATKANTELAEAYSAEKSQLQRNYAEQESLLKQQLETAEAQFARLQRHAEALKEEHAEVAGQLRGQLDNAEKVYAQHESELTGRLLEGQQRAARENAEQARDFLLQERVLHRQHSDQQGLLTGQLKTAQLEIERLLKHHAEREDRHAAIKDELNTKFDSALDTHLQRDRELTAQLLTNQQQAAKTNQEQVFKHFEQERGLRVQLAELTDLSNTEVRKLNADLAQRERLWEAGKNSFFHDIEILRTEAEALKQSSDQAEQQHSSAIKAEISERIQLIEARAALEAQLREEISLCQRESANLYRLHQSVQEDLVIIKKSFTWRTNELFRRLGLLVGFKSNQRSQHSRLEHHNSALPTAGDGCSSLSEANLSEFNQSTMSASPKSRAYSYVIMPKTLSELLENFDQRFVECAYRTLLGRDPDSEGMNYYLKRVRSGISKMEIVAQLKQSTEGKNHQSNLDGLKIALQKYNIIKIPLIGWIYKLFVESEYNNSTMRRVRAIENQIHRLGYELGDRLTELESKTAMLIELPLQSKKPADWPSQSTSADATQTTTQKHALKEDEISLASPRARNIYAQIKLSMIRNSRKTKQCV